MKRSLRPHQLKAFEYTLRQKHPALFMDMRLGKTLVAIRRINLYESASKILIVAPYSAFDSWIAELKKEAEPEPVLLRGTQAERLDLLSQNMKWYLFNHEGWRYLKEVGRMPWDCVVIDESTSIRNPQAKITQFYLKHFRKVAHRWILTGTPAPENDLEFWTQLAFLDGKAFGFSNFWNFRIEMFQPDFSGYGWTGKTGTAKKIQQTLGRRCFIQRREDVGLGKEQIVQSRSVEMPKKIRKIYAGVETNFELGEKRTLWQTTKYQWLRQLCGGFAEDEQLWSGKEDELVNLLKSELAHDPVVVWYVYNAELEASFKRLKKEKISCQKIRGSTSVPDRLTAIRDFQKGKFRVFLIQQKIGQMGMDLSRADTAIYFSQPIPHLDHGQTKDRILSLDKNSPLLYIYLTVKDSVDVDVYDSAAVKGLKSSNMLSAALRSGIAQRGINHDKTVW